MIKRIFLFLCVGLMALICIIAVNTWRYAPADFETVAPAVVSVDVDKAARNLSQAVTYKTVKSEMGTGAFSGFRDWLSEAYPVFTQATELTLIAENTPLYFWPGQNTKLAPILLAAHYDVVPVPAATLDRWVYPPFGGVIADGYVWGRGTLDDKGALVAMLEASEVLMASGFRPERGVYFSFGHDEETSGGNFGGAGQVAAYLNENQIELEWALDEGSFVLDNIIGGLPAPVASINLAEKGYLTLQLVASGKGGHSALPPTQTAVGVLAEAIVKVQNAPMPGGLTGVSEGFFDELGRHFGLPNKALFANRWLFGPVLERVLSSANTTNAMLRTTTAPTMLSGSATENVLPTEAVATVNFRLHPRDTIAGVIANVERVIDDARVEVRKLGAGSEASPVSDPKGAGYASVERAIRANFGEVIAVPGLTIAATDSRHYAKAAKNTYRINPFKITNDDLIRFHGLNERLSLENLERGIGFYHTLISGQ